MMDASKLFTCQSQRYLVLDRDGNQVGPGDTVIDFRGDEAKLKELLRGPEYNGTAKVSIEARAGWVNHSVFDLTVIPVLETGRYYDVVLTDPAERPLSGRVLRISDDGRAVTLLLSSTEEGGSPQAGAGSEVQIDADDVRRAFRWNVHAVEREHEVVA